MKRSSLTSPNGRSLRHRHWIQAACLGSVIALGGCVGGGLEPQMIGDASPAMSVITAAPTQIKSDGISTAAVTVELRDGNGSRLPNGGDIVDVSTDFGTLSALKDNNNGLYTATLTSSTTQATATISGSVNGAAIQTAKPTVAFIPSP